MIEFLYKEKITKLEMELKNKDKEIELLKISVKNAYAKTGMITREVQKTRKDNTFLRKINSYYNKI